MPLDERRRLVVEAGDVGLELLGLDPPLPAPADLDGRQVAGTDEGVRLRGRDAQQLGDVREGEEASTGHRGSLAPRAPRAAIRPRLWTTARRPAP